MMRFHTINTSLQQPQALIARDVKFAGFEHQADLFDILASIAGTAREDDFPGFFARGLTQANLTSGRAATIILLAILLARGAALLVLPVVLRGLSFSQCGCLADALVAGEQEE
jgi:hypothetical protein